MQLINQIFCRLLFFFPFYLLLLFLLLAFVSIHFIEPLYAVCLLISPLSSFSIYQLLFLFLLLSLFLVSLFYFLICTLFFTLFCHFLASFFCFLFYNSDILYNVGSIIKVRQELFLLFIIYSILYL